jgi:AsmA protein
MDGVFELKPITMRVFGGDLAGDIQADCSGPVPLLQIRCSLPHFRIEDFLETLSPKKAAEGAMDFSASLSMQGGTMSQMVETAAGEVSLRGENLTLVDNDLDRVLSRFESSQSFNLVDVGAVFLAGPLGLAVTKGYNFASLFRGSGGNTSIGTLVSDWRVERGVAQAKDVAMATTKNRIALQGGLDFVNGRFADLTVAVIDAGGCAKVRQAIRGSFEKPVVEKPRVLTSLAGPVLKLYRQTRGLFPAGPCEVFYSGSVAAPR